MGSIDMGLPHAHEIKTQLENHEIETLQLEVRDYTLRINDLDSKIAQNSSEIHELNIFIENMEERDTPLDRECQLMLTQKRERCNTLDEETNELDETRLKCMRKLNRVYIRLGEEPLEFDGMEDDATDSDED